MPAMPADTRPQQKNTLGEMRASGLRRLLVYCGDYKCGHHVEISADRWQDDVRLSDLEPLFVCTVCGHRGGDVRPLFDDTSGPNLTLRFAWGFPEELACASLGYAQANEYLVEPSRP
jgi:hypothetical protein